MGDLTKLAMSAAAGSLPKGLAFEIADLYLVRGWADLHDIQMDLRLDHGAEDEEYEEVIVFYINISPQCRLILWRSMEAVFVQPLVGRRLQYRSVSEALESLGPKQIPVLTDTTATEWPTVERLDGLVSHTVPDTQMSDKHPQSMGHGVFVNDHTTPTLSACPMVIATIPPASTSATP
jgi:hypothetical protein